MNITKYLSLILFSTILIFYSSSIKAQADSIKLMQVKNRLMDSVCACISTFDSTLINTAGDIQQLVAFCLTSNTQQVKNYFFVSGIDTTTLNQENGIKISQQIALEIIHACPYVQVLAKRVKCSSHTSQFYAVCFGHAESN